MNSLRMCVACREMKEKGELIRVVRAKGKAPAIDKSFKAQGRGAYVCKRLKCIEAAAKRRAFERSFSCPIGGELYDQMGDMINE